MFASQLKSLGKFIRATVTPALVCALDAVCVVASAAALAGVFPRDTHAEESGYRASVEKWRTDYESDLKSDRGWLTISGLFWLHEGENRFGSDPLSDIVLPEAAPADAGYFEFRRGKTTVHVKAGVPTNLGNLPLQRRSTVRSSCPARACPFFPTARSTSRPLNRPRR